MKYKFQAIHIAVLLSGIFIPISGYSQKRQSDFFKYTSEKVLLVLKEKQFQENQPLNVSDPSDSNLPKNLNEVAQIFESNCIKGLENRSVTQVYLKGNIQQLIYKCPTTAEHEFEFVFTQSTLQPTLLDIQVVSTNLNVSDSNGNASASPISKQNQDFRQIDFKDGMQIAIAVGISSLSSGLLARGAYPGEADKMHHLVAGNLIAAMGTLLAYYGFHLNKRNSTLVGIGLAVVVGILKEVSDGRNTRKHTVDIHDAIATSMGGVLGAGMIRIKFEF